MKSKVREQMKNRKNWKNLKCPIRTCASCEFTYWGLGREWKINKDCPKCHFGHYGAVYVYGWGGALWQLITKQKYRRKKSERKKGE